MTPKISIIVPCYNVEKYAEQCLSSIKQQTFTNIEVICVNDGSTDGTLSIIESFVDADNRFRLINKKNTGYGDSVNTGIDAACGDFIGIIEPDDFIESNMYETLYQVAMKQNLDFARCGFFSYANGRDTPHQDKDVPLNTVITPVNHSACFYLSPSVWVGLYRRTWLLENNIKFLPTPGASFQDTAFAFKAFACASRFMLIDAKLLHYRTDNQNSSVKSTSKVYSVCDEWEEIYRFIKQRADLNGKLNSLLASLQLKTYFWNIARLETSVRWEFVQHWHKEFKKRIDNKEMDFLGMPFKDRIKILALLKMPCLFYLLWVLKR